jgi:hypothetical protein
LANNNPAVLLVMAVKVAIGINMAKSHFLILHPDIALALYFQPATTVVMRHCCQALIHRF